MGLHPMSYAFFIEGLQPGGFQAASIRTTEGAPGRGPHEQVLVRGVEIPFLGPGKAQTSEGAGAFRPLNTIRSTAGL
jgi:hypothetical protein